MQEFSTITLIFEDYLSRDEVEPELTDQVEEYISIHENEALLQEEL